MTRNEFTLLFLLLALVSLTVFVIVGVATEHLFAHILDNFNLSGAAQ